MKILITGGAGYIGSILTPTLLAEGYSVTVLDSFLYNQTSLAECCSDERFRVIKGDARDEETVKRAMKDADVIIPLAAIVGAPASNLDKVAARSLNYDAVALVNRLRSKDQIVLYPTTNSGYGVGQEGVYCTEETPLNPLSLYAKTKAEAEKLLLDTGSCITFRLATVFGMSPRMRLDLLVNDFTYRAYSDRFIVLFEAHFKRNYIHVRDVARAFIHGLRNYESMKNNVFNVGLSTANLSKLELCQTIKSHISDFHFSIADMGKDPDQRNYIVSNEKIERTGYLPKHTLDMGVAELIKGFNILRNNKFTNL